jgi:predicted nucleic acid-binding Zn ribbon protein
MKSGAPPCLYCGAPLATGTWLCARCGRDSTAPRRPCTKCGRVTPTAERACLNCGSVFKSDMRWKVPLIIFLFLLGIVLSVVVALVRVLLG